MNNFTFTGNIGKDPEIKFSKNRTCILRFSVGISRAKKVNGETQYETDWTNCEMYGTAAERASEQLRRGTPVIATGRYVQEKYQTQSGENKVYHKCIVNDIGILVSRAKKNTGEFDSMGKSVDEEIPF